MPRPAPPRPDAARAKPARATSGAGTNPVSAIPNLGPASEAVFARAGIHSAEALAEMGADAAYLRLLQSGSRPHFIAYYALAMGLQGRRWNDCKGAEKAALRLRFDALKAAGHDKGRSEFEAALNEIGLRPAADG